MAGVAIRERLEGLCLPPQSLGRQEWGCPLPPLLPHPPGNPGGAEPHGTGETPPAIPRLAPPPSPVSGSAPGTALRGRMAPRVTRPVPAGPVPRGPVGETLPPHRAPRTPGTASPTPPRAPRTSGGSPGPGAAPAALTPLPPPTSSGGSRAVPRRPGVAAPGPAAPGPARLGSAGPGSARAGAPRVGARRAAACEWRRPRSAARAGAERRERSGAAAAPPRHGGGFSPGARAGRRRRKMAPVRLCRRLPAPRDPRGRGGRAGGAARGAREMLPERDRPG